MLAPVLKWPGSKWTLAQWIIDQMPPHRCYLDPYFGSGAVFFLKNPSLFETVNDLDSNVANLFRVLREQPANLAKAIEMTPWARDEFKLSHEHSTDPLESARRFLTRTWQSINGNGGWRIDREGNRSGGNRTRTWNNLPQRILDVATRLKDAQIENRPAIEVIKRHRFENTLLYVDPPYSLETRSNNLYDLEMTDADHAVLLDVLDAHPGPVLLSGYACPLYDDRLKHWTRLTHDATAERGKKRTEVLWMNPECVRRQGRLFT
jgi:DNA adenine methylase